MPLGPVNFCSNGIILVVHALQVQLNVITKLQIYLYDAVLHANLDQLQQCWMVPHPQ